MNTGCFKCDKAQWDADGCTCEITGQLVGNAERGCEYRKDIELKPCPICKSKVTITHTDDGYIPHCTHSMCILSNLLMKPRETEDEAAMAWNKRD